AAPAVRIEEVERQLGERLAHLDDLVAEAFTQRGSVRFVDDDRRRVLGQAPVRAGRIPIEIDIEIVDRQVWIDPPDAGDHGIGGHGWPSVLPREARRYPSAMA